MQTGTVPLTGDRLGVEGDLGAELLSDAAGGCVSRFGIEGVVKGLGVLSGRGGSCQDHLWVLTEAGNGLETHS